MSQRLYQPYKIIFLSMGVLFAFAVLLLPLARSQDAASPVQDFVDTVSSEKGMTLWQVLMSGGWVMIILSGVSLLMTALIVYLFANLRPAKLVPKTFVDEAVTHLRRGNTAVVRTACEGKENIAAKILRAATEKAGEGKASGKEAIEITARQEVGSLWTGIGYLTDIAAIAPMLGLLGTVIGMIEAFNAIAFQTAVVKPILLAGGVSKAMVTTAAGLVIAIIAMIFFSFFRGRVQTITNSVEVMTSEILDIFSKNSKA